jgi:hypothetical protein
VPDAGCVRSRSGRTDARPTGADTATSTKIILAVARLIAGAIIIPVAWRLRAR